MTPEEKNATGLKGTTFCAELIAARDRAENSLIEYRTLLLQAIDSLNQITGRSLSERKVELAMEIVEQWDADAREAEVKKSAEQPAKDGAR